MGVRHVEGESLDMAANPAESFQASRFGEAGWLESHDNAFKQVRRGTRGKVMADKTHVGKILRLHVGEQVIAARVIKPEAQKGGAGGQDQITDGAVGLGCCSLLVNTMLHRWVRSKGEGLTSPIHGGRRSQRDLSKQQFGACARRRGGCAGIAAVAVSRHRTLQRRRRRSS